MVSKPLSEILVYATPALASLAVAGSAWWTAPGRVGTLRARRTAVFSACRVVAKRWIPVALVALISVTLGVLAYSGHAPDVSRSQALAGAAIALLACGMALSMYWALGRLVRRLPFLVVGWIASLVPLYAYALLALLIVAGHTQCGPEAYECPL